MGLLKALLSSTKSLFPSLRKLLPAEWYLYPRVDAYIFVVFSWVVWVPLFSAFGVYGLIYGAFRLGAYWKHLPHIGGWQTFTWFPWALSKKSPESTPSLGTLADPHTDLDLTTTTDSEDLAVFAADVLEFAEQDHALLLDSLFEVGVGGLLVGGAFVALMRKTLPSSLIRRR